MRARAGPEQRAGHAEPGLLSQGSGFMPTPSELLCAQGQGQSSGPVAKSQVIFSRNQGLGKPLNPSEQLRARGQGQSSVPAAQSQVMFSKF